MCCSQLHEHQHETILSLREEEDKYFVNTKLILLVET